MRLSIMLLVLSLFTTNIDGQSRIAVVADSLTCTPLANASIFNRKGNFVGTSDSNGGISCASASDYPITIRYMGFYEKVVPGVNVDTIFLQENITQLPEVVVESRQKKMLHILAYMREYSTLSTYTDTVTLFREKMVDFMLPDDRKSHYAGWRNPRILNSQSYYRFTNAYGLDSVSDRCNQHFTWSDWVGILPPRKIPSRLAGVENGTDTLSGKYGSAEIWVKNGDKISLDVNVLADMASRKWVPNLSTFFNYNVDFEQFRLRLNYNNVINDSIMPLDLTGYSFNIESRGRGRGMFKFNRYDEPFFVATYTEVYVLDKEFISVKEAKKWEHWKFNTDEIKIYEPMEAPDLQPSIQALVDRVNNVNNDKIRLTLAPDYRLAGRKVKRNFGYRVLQDLKLITGISRVRAKRDWDKQWRKFRNNQVKRNNQTDSVQ